MPGAGDPSDYSLPQQPLRPLFFPRASALSTFSLCSNPHSTSISGVSYEQIRSAQSTQGQQVGLVKSSLSSQANIPSHLPSSPPVAFSVTLAKPLTTSPALLVTCPVWSWSVAALLAVTWLRLPLMSFPPSPRSMTRLFWRSHLTFSSWATSPSSPLSLLRVRLELVSMSSQPMSREGILTQPSTQLGLNSSPLLSSPLSDHGSRVRVVLLPAFSKTPTIALVDLQSLECTPVTFDLWDE